MMLSRIPFWGWLVMIITALYLVYNPLGFSVWHMWAMGDPTQLLPFKMLVTLLLAALLGLVLHGAVSTTSWVGAVVMVSLVLVGMWSVHTVVWFDLLDLEMWGWILQPILGLILTVGWQWPKIWRRATGVVSVNDPDTPG
jgi:energy-converting hydrogenase Eha subunit C